MMSLFGDPPQWPAPTRGVSEICLALRYRSNDSLLRHFKDTSTLYLEIVDYPGEWLLDLPLLEQNYLAWSRQMLGLLQGERALWAKPWLDLCDKLDPLAPLMKIFWRRLRSATPITCCAASRKGCILFSRGALCCRVNWLVRRFCNFSRGRRRNNWETSLWRRRMKKHARHAAPSL